MARRSIFEAVRYRTSPPSRPADDGREGDNHETQQIRDGDRGGLRGRGDLGNPGPCWTDASGAPAAKIRSLNWSSTLVIEGKEMKTC